ncbi:MAG: response regulator [Desulfobulbaceae bacterium]|nr:response regulator [Desulfobulbaceae bacterium]
MIKIDSKQAQDEIIADIRAKDLIKAQIVLDYFSRIGEKEQRRILYELNRCDDDEFSVLLMVYLLVRNEESGKKYPDISESILAKVLNDPHIIIRHLQKPCPEQQYFIKLAGDLRLHDALPQLIGVLFSAAETNILITTLSVLGEIGDPDAVNSVTEILHSGGEKFICPAIRALGRIASPTAMQRLSEYLGQNFDADILILDIFATVQNDLCLKILNETMQVRSARLRNFSKMKLISLGEKAVPILISNILNDDPDLQIHSLNALQEIGDESAVMPIRKLIYRQPKNANVRFAAFEALADLPVRKGDYVWANGLIDADSSVRVAAARAIEGNFDDVLAAGIRNMVKTEDDDAAMVIRAILDCQAKNIFLDLIRHDVSIELISEYLKAKAHPDVRNFFVQVLLEAGFSELAESILSGRKKKTVIESQSVWAVDDSRMILNIYRSVLNELGYDPVLFQNPLKALEQVETEKPKFICTDLNMPEMTGIDLTRAIRKIYNKDELPVIMITTQNDVQDNSEAYKGGVNLVACKPFDTGSLKEAIDRVLVS